MGRGQRLEFAAEVLQGVEQRPGAGLPHAAERRVGDLPGNFFDAVEYALCGRAAGKILQQVANALRADTAGRAAAAGFPGGLRHVLAEGFDQTGVALENQKAAIGNEGLCLVEGRKVLQSFQHGRRFA